MDGSSKATKMIIHFLSNQSSTETGFSKTARNAASPLKAPAFSRNTTPLRQVQNALPQRKLPDAVIQAFPLVLFKESLLALVVCFLVDEPRVLFSECFFIEVQ